MNNFLVPSSSNKAAVAGGSEDLLSLLQQQRAAKQALHSAPKPAPTSTSASSKKKSVQQTKEDDLPNQSTTSVSSNKRVRPSDAENLLNGTPHSAWEAREQRTLSMLDVNCEQRRQHIQAKNFTGWKLNAEGNRVYTTFRHGQRVQAGGQEGFFLALGDGAVKKRKATDVEDLVKVYQPPPPAASSSSSKITKAAEGQAKLTSFFK